MEVEDVSPALRARLGPEATVGLLALLESSREECAHDVMNQAVERFDRELTRQISALRHDMHEGDTALRHEMREGDAALRLEMRDMGVALVREIAALGSTLRSEMAAQRVELLKWSFAFWIAQFVSIGGLMAVLLRNVRP